MKTYRYAANKQTYSLLSEQKYSGPARALALAGLALALVRPLLSPAGQYPSGALARNTHQILVHTRGPGPVRSKKLPRNGTKTIPYQNQKSEGARPRALLFRTLFSSGSSSLSRDGSRKMNGSNRGERRYTSHKEEGAADKTHNLGTFATKIGHNLTATKDNMKLATALLLTKLVSCSARCSSTATKLGRSEHLSRGS